MPIVIGHILRLDPIFAHACIAHKDHGWRAAFGQIVETGRPAGSVAHLARYGPKALDVQGGHGGLSNRKVGPKEHHMRPRLARHL